MESNVQCGSCGRPVYMLLLESQTWKLDAAANVEGRKVTL